MKRPPLHHVLIAAAVLVVAVVVGTVGYLFTRDTSPKSPRVVNEQTDARRVRVLRPGPQPGFPAPKLEREKHERDG